MKVAVCAELMKGFVERRRLERTKWQLPAKIVFGEQSFVLDCTIRDFAAGGVCVAVGNADVLPERIVLIEPRRLMAFDAKIKWRCGNVIGLSFEKVTFLNETLEPHQRLLKMHADLVRKEWGS
jgi:hypothetical protein